MRIVRNISEPVLPAGAPVGGACDDVRCGCGSLLARVVDGGVELKCRRCKQVWRLALADAGGRAPRWRLLEGGTR